MSSEMAQSSGTTSKEHAVQALVRTCVASYAEGFRCRHEGEVDKPDGVINMKIHNIFIEALGPQLQYYTALVRSLDSSLGNMLEKLAIEIAKLSFEVRREVSGSISDEQIATIATILENYKSRRTSPSVKDYEQVRQKKSGERIVKQHSSDYYLIDPDTSSHYLIELKIGGDLDNKKARSEKEAIMEQYSILSNSLPDGATIRTYFATAYNRFGEGQKWKQERVRRFFADEELLIGGAFWNFVCQSDRGYGWVLKAYRESAHHIRDALDSIRSTYLGE